MFVLSKHESVAGATQVTVSTQRVERGDLQAIIRVTLRRKESLKADESTIFGTGLDLAGTSAVVVDFITDKLFNKSFVARFVANGVSLDPAVVKAGSLLGLSSGEGTKSQEKNVFRRVHGRYQRSSLLALFANK